MGGCLERCQRPQKAGEAQEAGWGERGGMEKEQQISHFLEVLFRTGLLLGWSQGTAAGLLLTTHVPSALYQPHGH